MPPGHSPLRLRSGVLAAAALSGALVACKPDRVVTAPAYPYDYRDRHPIVLAEGPRSLDVFPTSPSGIDSRQRADVRAFAAEFRKHGQGALTAQVPSGANDVAVQRAMAAVQDALAEGGLPGGYVSVSTYRPSDPTMASPIRLTFSRLKARVSGKCGLWPQDLGVSDVAFNVKNEPYWNYGCSMQATVAAQVADPVDLVRGRQETAQDTLRRTKAIQSLRDGKDPSTQYRDQQTKISSGVGN